MLTTFQMGKENSKQEQTIAKIRASVMAFDEDGDDDLFQDALETLQEISFV